MDDEPTCGVATPADRDLLRAFVERADEAAFAELVARHGPLVLGACRRVVGPGPDAEDAFQATFLVLARKAGSVRHPERLGAWLHGVALRCAFQTRKAARRALELPMTELPDRDPPDPAWADVAPILDAEIGRLPVKLRTALVLCELQGLNRAAAADRLGVPEGTLSSRLSRAKAALRGRLIRRGVTLTVAALGLVLARTVNAATLPPALAVATAKAARGFATGAVVGGPAVLARRAMVAATARKLVALVAVAVMGLTLAGVILWVRFGPEAAPDDRARLQGNWRVAAAQFAGEDVREWFGANVAIDGQEFKFSTFGVSYTIDPGQAPKTIDLVFPFGDMDPPVAQHGVYELTETTLTIHLAIDGGGRPPGFQPVAGRKTLKMVLQRAGP
jgi:RNA polymerase sigma factor (sigma-70 family)